MRVSIFGLGYVGCVTAGCFTKDGHEVVGVDILPSKVGRLASGKPTVVEAGIDDLIADAHRSGRLTATQDSRRAVLETDASIICVGTPNAKDGRLDLTAVRETARAIGRAIMDKPGGHLVMNRSTVPPGTAEELVQSELLEHSGRTREDIGLAVVPEFLREGCAIADYYDPPFVPVGVDEHLTDEHRAMIEALFGGVVEKIDYIAFAQAEMLKALCNVFHALKVSFANEVGALCSALSIDGRGMMQQLVEDRKLNISPAYLRPGLPFGGSCLPKDLRMILNLANRSDVDLPLLKGVMASNESHSKRALDEIRETGCRKIALDGLAFKAGTDDLRESPMVQMAEVLIGKGYDLMIYDPAIQESRLTGANRDYIEHHIPHLSSRLAADEEAIMEHAEVIVFTREESRLRELVGQMFNPPQVVDLTGRSQHLAAQSRMSAAPVRSQQPAARLARI